MTPITIGFLHHNSPLISGKSHLDSKEKKHLDKLPGKNKKKAFIAGRILCRTMIAHHAAVRPMDVHIKIEETGRPLIEHPPSLFSNISHSGELSVCAVAQSPIGIDVEQRRQERHFDEIAEAYFHQSEIEAIQREHKKDMKIFYRYWTMKEAFLKACGRSIRELGCIPPLLEQGKESRARCFELPGDYTLSLYAPNSVSGLTIRIFSRFGMDEIKNLEDFSVGYFDFGLRVPLNTGGRT